MKKDILLLKLNKLEDERARYKYLMEFSSNASLYSDLSRCEKEIRKIKKKIKEL